MRHDIQRLIAHVNRKGWWHVKPADISAYEKRGKFLASSFQEAEFYGPTWRPTRESDNRVSGRGRQRHHRAEAHRPR